MEVWAYCLMPNHVHLIAVPESPESLRRALGSECLLARLESGASSAEARAKGAVEAEAHRLSGLSQRLAGRPLAGTG